MFAHSFFFCRHVLITIMASVGSGSAYATDVVAVQRVFYNQTWNFSYQWLVTMSTQLIGFSIGGICRRFLVSPPSMSECIQSLAIVQLLTPLRF